MLVIYNDGLPGPTGTAEPSAADGTTPTIAAGATMSVAYNRPLTIIN